MRRVAPTKSEILFVLTRLPTNSGAGGAGNIPGMSHRTAARPDTSAPRLALAAERGR